jgi:hypothetical protein
MYFSAGFEMNKRRISMDTAKPFLIFNSSFLIGKDPELRDWLFEDILQGQEYVDLQNEYRAYDAEFLYNILKEDTTMMFLGGDRDADYQSFFDSIR